MRCAVVLLSLLALAARADEPVANTKLGGLRGTKLGDRGV